MEEAPDQHPEYPGNKPLIGALVVPITNAQTIRSQTPGDRVNGAEFDWLHNYYDWEVQGR